jgi:hypothetical protein
MHPKHVLRLTINAFLLHRCMSRERRWFSPGSHAGELPPRGSGRLLYAPQYISGGGYNTSVTVLNLDSIPTTVTIAWMNNEGRRIGLESDWLHVPDGRCGMDVYRTAP